MFLSDLLSAGPLQFIVELSSSDKIVCSHGTKTTLFMCSYRRQLTGDLQI
jgi:hypothetical protein